MDPASVTQLAYSHLSISMPPGGQPTVARGEEPFFMPRIGFRCARHPRLSAELRSACRRGQSCAFAGGGGERDRTDDLLLAKQALSQLSYTPFSEVGDQRSEVKKVRVGAAFLISDL